MSQLELDFAAPVHCPNCGSAERETAYQQMAEEQLRKLFEWFERPLEEVMDLSGVDAESRAGEQHHHTWNRARCRAEIARREAA